MGKMATAHNEYRLKYRMPSKIVEHSLTGRKKAVKPSPSGRLAAPVPAHFLKFFRRGFSIQPDPTRESRGVWQGPLLFLQGTGCRYDSLIGTLSPPPRSIPGPTGAFQERILFYRGWIGKPDHPSFAPQHSPTLAPAIKLPRARV